MYADEVIPESYPDIDMEIIARPLEKKGFNKCFLDIVSADVFKKRKPGFLGKIKNFFSV